MVLPSTQQPLRTALGLASLLFLLSACQLTGQVENANPVAETTPVETSDAGTPPDAASPNGNEIAMEPDNTPPDAESAEGEGAKEKPTEASGNEGAGTSEAPAGQTASPKPADSQGNTVTQQTPISDKPKETPGSDGFGRSCRSQNECPPSFLCQIPDGKEAGKCVYNCSVVTPETMDTEEKLEYCCEKDLFYHTANQPGNETAHHRLTQCRTTEMQKNGKPEERPVGNITSYVYSDVNDCGTPISMTTCLQEVRKDGAVNNEKIQAKCHIFQEDCEKSRE